MSDETNSFKMCGFCVHLFNKKPKIRPESRRNSVASHRLDSAKPRAEEMESKRTSTVKEAWISKDEYSTTSNNKTIILDPSSLDPNRDHGKAIYPAGTSMPTPPHSDLVDNQKDFPIIKEPEPWTIRRWQKWSPFFNRMTAARKKSRDLEEALAALESNQVPLNDMEIQMVMGSWEIIKQRSTEAGMGMFGRLLKGNPKVKNTFEKFRQMDPSADLSDSSVFATHAMVVMSAFEDIFENLDDPDIVKDILNQGRSHSKFSEDFAPETFWAIEEPFLQSIKEVLGKKMTRQLERLYQRTIKFILAVLIRGLRETLR